MKLVLLLAAALVGVWLVRRARRTDGRRVTVAWEDGSELELRPDTPARDGLLEIAEGTLEPAPGATRRVAQ
jgi:hypothetical protein